MIRTPRSAATTLTEHRYRRVRKVTLVGSFADFALGVGKILIGIGSHSQALVADGLLLHLRQLPEQPPHRVIGNARGHRQQRDSKRNGRECLNAAMTIGMLMVGFFGAKVDPYQNRNIGRQIRKRMESVRQ